MHLRKNRVLALSALLALAACSGDTGQQGPKGDTGATGATGATGGSGEAPVAKTEACYGCHGATLAETHALSEARGVEVTMVKQVKNEAGQNVWVADPASLAVVSGTDLVLNFIVKVNGVPRADFDRRAGIQLNHNEDAWWVYETDDAKLVCPPASGCQVAPSDTGPAGIRTKIAPFLADNVTPSWTFTGSSSGRYVLTLKGFAATPPANGTAYMLSIMNPTGVTATVVAYYNGRVHDLVSSQACINCHGTLVWKGANHDVTSPQGVEACVVCHARLGAADPQLPGRGSGLMGIVHGIHNSANMADGTYTFTWTNGNKFNFSKGFPGNMNNCATCHDSDARLAAVNDAPVSYALCISCHGDWDGFSATVENGPLDFHRIYTAMTPVTACAVCHDGATAPATIAAFHDGLVTERAGLIWDGADQSVVLGKTIQLDITGVTVNGSNLEITWTAKNPQNGNAAYDPCNQDFANGPVFFGYDPGTGTEGCTNTAKGCASSFSILRSYALANDWVNDNLAGSTSPGQPAGSTSLKSSNTTCDASHVATTVVPVQTTTATRGVVALQGKPQVKFGPSSTIVWVRAQTPTREFVVSSGALPTTQRREIVDIQKCIACHLGTVYQHGGTRVDKIELCVMCHNPAASEQNRRLAMGITEANAYDGKSGESYDLRYMVHAIHSAGESGQPLMYYRTNGVFFFGSTDNLPPNWPPVATPAACVTCFDKEDGTLTYCPVVGSSTSGQKYKVNPDGTCDSSEKSTSGTWLPHRVIAVHYPRALNDCGACHIATATGTTADALPDPTKAVALTYEAGAAPWNNLTDDVLIGPSTASCMSCHQRADGVDQAYLRKHAYDNSWWPTAFDGGRQALIDAVGTLMDDVP